MFFEIWLLQSHFNASYWFQRIPSLQSLILVSTLSFTSMLDFSCMLLFTSTQRSHRVRPSFFKFVSFNLTSMLYLSFKAFLHFKALPWFQPFPPLQCFTSLQCLTSVPSFPPLGRRGHDGRMSLVGRIPGCGIFT